jgi:hypothetical protein
MGCQLGSPCRTAIAANVAIDLAAAGAYGKPAPSRTTHDQLPSFIR